MWPAAEQRRYTVVNLCARKSGGEYPRVCVTSRGNCIGVVARVGVFGMPAKGHQRIGGAPGGLLPSPAGTGGGVVEGGKISARRRRDFF